MKASMRFAMSNATKWLMEWNRDGIERILATVEAFFENF